MAPENNETAEQKLLKMFETSSDQEVSQKKQKKSVGKEKSSIGFLKTLNKVLIVGIIVAAFFLMQEVKAGNTLMAQEVDTSSVSSLARSGSSETFVPIIGRDGRNHVASACFVYCQPGLYKQPWVPGLPIIKLGPRCK